MTMTQSAGANRGALERPGGSSLAEVIDTILDKGLVIDAYVRVSLVGIELLTIDARVVVASVDTYLRFAEAVNRVDLRDDGTKGLPDLLDSAQESGAQKKVRGAAKGAIGAAGDAVREFLDRGEDDDGRQGRQRDRARRGSEG